ncbi:transposase [Burkholderia sp. BCC1630]|uniref:transposase n=1 Tax=Burkholderia sp. BCC1630 TaxID=2676304 RepID=UPI00158F5ED7|nr:transposase [Burkholderia sp. BCC1630]
MTEQPNLRSRLVVGRKRDARRQFDEAARQELVEFCLKPGVSITRTAMDHDVNPNQLRRWISHHQQHTLQTPSPDTSLMALSLHVRLSNGVEFDLGEASVDELATVIQMLAWLMTVAGNRCP